MMASPRLITLQLPPGKLGVDIQEAKTGGSCLVLSKTNHASPLQVGDIILSLNGHAFAPHRQAEWLKIIRASAAWSTRTAVVCRRQAASCVPVSIRVAATKHQEETSNSTGAALGGHNHNAVKGPGKNNVATPPKTKLLATKPAASESVSTQGKNMDLAAMVQQLESKGSSETEAQKKLREMREARAAISAQRNYGGYTEAEKLDKEKLKQERALTGQKKAAQATSDGSPLSYQSDKTEEDTIEQPTYVMVRLLDTALAKVETLENDLRLKDQSYQALKTEMMDMKCDLGCVKGMLDEEKGIHQETNMKLSAAEERIQALEKDITAKEDLNGNLRSQLQEIKNTEEGSQEDLLLMDTVEHLRKELSIAKETETLLQKRISQFESDKNTIGRERDDAKKKSEEYNTIATTLQEEVKEQLSAIGSLVELLERQRTDHSKQLADKDDQIASLKK